jgi:hypothetical protein
MTAANHVYSLVALPKSQPEPARIAPYHPELTHPASVDGSGLSSQEKTI